MQRRTWWAVAALSLAIGCSNGTPPAEVDSGTLPDDTGNVTPEDIGNLPPDDTGNVVPEDTGPTPCPTGQTRCGEQCIDTASSNDHCGSCGTVCSAGQSCVSGACTMPMECPAGQSRCGERCVDTATSGDNCGSCGNACPSGQTCMAGTCMAECPSGQTSCSGQCVNAQTDGNNCGACGNACVAGQSCMGGTCMASVTCMTGQTACAGQCVSTQTDVNNCGACGNACAAGQTCTAGACMARMCPSGQTDCNGACVNTQTDATNCGMCGRSCSAGQTCTNGSCTDSNSCPTGQTRCTMGGMAVCVDTNSDNLNCGRCSNACATGQMCSSGQCMTQTMQCGAGQTLCGSTCVDTNTSAANCGRCANACATGTTCQSGVCTCASGQTLCGRSCVNTQTDAANCGACGRACAAGQTCSAGTCSGSTCMSGQTLCGSTCVNLQTSNTNCGMCGTACANGQACAAGRCACPSGTSTCSNRCVNLQTDNANCGMCGTACANGQSCTAGRCACPTGQTTCNGRCVNTMTDPNNCGMCGRACMAGTACSAGSCRGAAPANDTLAGATVISLATPNVTLMADTTNARNNTTGSCGCTSGNDVYYRFALTAPEVVYADTIGTTWDTSLFLQDSMGRNLTSAGTTGGVTCNDDSSFCNLGGTNPTRQSQIVARLAAGTYYLVLSGCNNGPATIHFQHLPAGNGPAAQLTPSGTLQTAAGATSGTGAISAACCSGGADNTYWWLTCPDATAVPFYASSCAGSAAFDIELDQRSANRSTGTSVCNDDTGFTCGTGATVTSNLPAGAGLHTLTVDACTGSGNYSIRYVQGACTTGLTRCATCVDTQNDNNNCGGCNRACGAGTFCRGGACVTPPTNDTRTGATVINLTNASSILSANTTNARNDTAGSCGCTTGNDVFYRFTLAAEEIVYADTVGTTWDTSLFLQGSTGTNLTNAAGFTNGATCNDDNGLNGCATARQSQILARLGAGTYFLVLSGCGAGASQIRFQHLPTGNGPIAFLPAGSGRVYSGTTSGTGRVTSTACGSGGPENMYYWYTCQGAAAATFTASTCFRASWDTSVHQRSPGRTTEQVCNDDSGGLCGQRSNLSTSIPAGPGLHAMYVDGFSSSASGSYSVLVTRP
ncbi:MAG: hypothetical protein JNK72_07005 [Myxococcales bacterium]|nr:hypothetical protein [Myxococcales bacterium]